MTVRSHDRLPRICRSLLADVLFVCVAAAFVVSNLRGHYPRFGSIPGGWLHGWPLTYLCRVGAPPLDEYQSWLIQPRWLHPWMLGSRYPNGIFDFDPAALAVDAFAVLLVFFATLYTTQHWLGMRPRPLQFGVRAILLAPLVVGIVFALMY